MEALITLKALFSYASDKGVGSEPTRWRVDRWERSYLPVYSLPSGRSQSSMCTTLCMPSIAWDTPVSLFAKFHAISTEVTIELGGHIFQGAAFNGSGFIEKTVNG